MDMQISFTTLSLCREDVRGWWGQQAWGGQTHLDPTWEVKHFGHLGEGGGGGVKKKNTSH